MTTVSNLLAGSIATAAKQIKTRPSLEPHHTVPGAIALLIQHGFPVSYIQMIASGRYPFPFNEASVVSVVLRNGNATRVLISTLMRTLRSKPRVTGRFVKHLQALEVQATKARQAQYEFTSSLKELLESNEH